MSDNIQLSLVKQTISDAKDSKDQNRILDALSAGLIATMECTSHTSEVMSAIAKAVDEIKDSIKDVLDLDKRVKELELKFLKYEERGRGAGWVVKVAIGSGLVTGGAILSCLPKLVEKAFGA